MGELTAEEALERLVVYTAMENGQLALDCERALKPLLAIAARVLDEGAVEKLAETVADGTNRWKDAVIAGNHDAWAGAGSTSIRAAAQAIINYLKESGNG